MSARAASPAAVARLEVARTERTTTLTYEDVSVTVDAATLARMRAVFTGSASAFDAALFRLLLRYKALQGTSDRRMGSQAAVPRRAMQTLLQAFDVDTECCASPWNFYAGFALPGPAPARYFSAFPDTDLAFGSAGNFLHLDAKGDTARSIRGLELNPPFYVEVSEPAIAKTRELLERAEAECRPLTAVVVVPSRAEEAGVRWCATGPYTAAELFYAPRASSFLQATYCAAPAAPSAARGGSEEHRRSSHPLSVFILQTPAAARATPCTLAKLRQLYASFSPSSDVACVGSATSPPARAPARKRSNTARRVGSANADSAIW